MDLNLNGSCISSSGSGGSVENSVNNTDSHANSQIDSLMMHNELNSNNYETNLNLTLNHLSQLINLSTQDCMINPGSNCSATPSSNSDNSHNSSTNELHNENNETISPSSHHLDLEKSFDSSPDGTELDLDKKSKQLEISSNQGAQLDEHLFSIPLTASTLFLSDEVNSSSISSSNHTNILNNENLGSPVIIAQQQQQQTNHNQNIKSQLNRFNYKCIYCASYSTKFKAHIIEHMSNVHKICLMQCPEMKCGKRFKDEWKLKRHLASNREHGPLANFKTLNDIMKMHMDITPQKVGYPCPLCELDPMSGDCLMYPDQSPSDAIERVLVNNSNNFLYFDTYDELKSHAANKHPLFNIDLYFICKQCGQVFQSRYKLSCHLFNVHSGKRKNRKRLIPVTRVLLNENKNEISFTNSINDFINKNFDLNGEVKQQAGEQEEENRNASEVDCHITSVINSVATGSDSISASRIGQSSLLFSELQSLQRPTKIFCIICNKKFKRARDLMSHIKIMHKSMSDEERQSQQAQLETYKLVSKAGSEAPRSRVCFVCSKVFKETPGSMSGVNKTFVRHMQIQHGLNEYGERLVECPVCEKNFFNRQQMERHMHTHEVWVEEDGADERPSPAKMPKPSHEDQKESMPDFKDSHSILYCHECVECKRFYKSIKVLTSHKLEAHRLRPVYRCANTCECNQEFNEVSSFLEHAKIHAQKNIFCPRCKLKFTNKNSLRHHMKNIHYNRKLTSKKPPSANPSSSATNRMLNNCCTNCKARFNDSNELQKHLKEQINCFKQEFSLHSKTPTQTEATSVLTTTTTTTNSLSSAQHFSCPTCRAVFPSRNSLHNHLATHSTNDLRLFLCDLCGSSFKTRKDLSRHASLHDSSKHKTCQECGMTFKTSFHLKRHSLTRHSNIRPFKCNHCEMTFARKDKLKQHEAKHVNHPLYECAECGKGFYRKEHLKDHEISKHSKMYPFSCEHCSKGFVHAKDLHRHIRVRHLGTTITTSLPANFTTTTTATQTPYNASSTSTNTPATTVEATVKQAEKLDQLRSEIKLRNNLKNENLNSKTSTSPQNNDFKSKKISSILKSNLFQPSCVVLSSGSTISNESFQATNQNSNISNTTTTTTKFTLINKLNSFQDQINSSCKTNLSSNNQSCFESNKIKSVQQANMEIKTLANFPTQLASDDANKKYFLVYFYLTMLNKFTNKIRILKSNQNIQFFI